MAEIRVADVSRWQGSINWDTIKQEVNGVVIKATGADGGLYRDGMFARNRDEARRVGIPRWFYHFKGSGSATDQAKYFLSNIGELQPGEGLVLDDENEAQINVNFAAEFADVVKKATGLNIVLYSNQSRFGGVNLQPIKDRNIGAWSAKYGSNSGQPEGSPATAGILTVIMWQYTSRARLAAVTANTVDMNIFYGDVNAFQKYGPEGAVKPKEPIPVPPSVGTGTYTVVKGDTLSGIAQKMGTPGGYPALATLNGIVPPYIIYPGQVLKVYGGYLGASRPPAAPSAGTYTVVKGDTLSGIGAKTGTSWPAIAELNGIKPPYIIYPGQVLKLPGGGSTPAPRTYTVVSGDTLIGIGKKTGTDWRTIASMNGINPPYTIYPGQVLKV